MPRPKTRADASSPGQLAKRWGLASARVRPAELGWIAALDVEVENVGIAGVGYSTGKLKLK